MNRDYDELSPVDKEARSIAAVRHVTAELHELVDLRSRQVLARAILGHSDNPVCRQALAALEGQPLTDIVGEGT